MAQGRAKELCGANKKAAPGTCGKPAGWGTDHNGIGRCKLHGGSTPSQIKNVEKQQAAAAAETYGLSREIDPHAALLEELHRTAGHVAYLAQLIRDLEQRELKQYQSMEAGGVVERPAIWVQLYQDERKHFAHVAKTCISVGIEERRVQLAEQQGALIATAIRGILKDLGVDDKPEVPEIVRRHLTLVSAAA